MADQGLEALVWNQRGPADLDDLKVAGLDELVNPRSTDACELHGRRYPYR